MTLNRNARPGDEARHTGDEIGLPHPETDGTRLSEVAAPKGAVVTHNGSEIVPVTGDESDAVAGVVFEYPLQGDNHGSFNEYRVREDRKATVKARGAVYADLTPYVDGAPTVEAGEALGPCGEILVVEEAQNGENLYEVLVR